MIRFLLVVGLIYWHHRRLLPYQRAVFLARLSPWVPTPLEGFVRVAWPQALFCLRAGQVRAAAELARTQPLPTADVVNLSSGRSS